MSVFAQADLTAPEATADTATSTAADPLVTNHPYKTEQLMSDRVFSDFVVGPGRFELEIAPGETKTVEIVVTNRMGIPKTFQLTKEDMRGNTDPAQAVALMGDRDGPYSIRNFITVPQDKFVLNHAERVRIPVTVSLPSDAEPGGFYGSLLTEIVSEDVDAITGEVVPSSKIISRIGTLFFVTTPGEISNSLELLEFSTLADKRFFTKGPVEFGIVTENTGTVHVTPYGVLRILNTMGNEVGYVEIPPWYVLPNSIRTKEIKWAREFLVGRYTAVLEMNRGYDGIVDEVKYSFWVIPLELVAGVFVTFFLVFFVLKFFFTRFEFKRKERG